MRIETSRPLVFICSPLAGNLEHNIQNARMYCHFAMKKGAIPFAPHLLFTQFMDEHEEAERELGISFGLAMLEKCDSLWAFDGMSAPGGVVSRGMRVEIDKARKLGMLIKYFDMKCVEVSPFA